MSIENPEKYKEFKTETLIDVINSCSFTVENYKRFIQEKSDYLDKSFSVDHITHLLLARSQLNDSIVTSVSEKFFKQNKIIFTNFSFIFISLNSKLFKTSSCIFLY